MINDDVIMFSMGAIAVIFIAFVIGHCTEVVSIREYGYCSALSKTGNTTMFLSSKCRAPR